MNFFTLKSKLTLVVASAVILNSCALQNYQKKLSASDFKTDSEVLEVLGDSVLIAFKGTIPPNAFPKKGIAKVEPYIKYGSNELPLTPMTIQGEKAKGRNQVISLKEGGTFAYVDKIAYTPDMKNSELKLSSTVRIKYPDEVQDRCLDIVSNKTLEKGMVTTSLTQRDKDDVIISNENFDPAKVDPKSYFSADKFESEKSVIKSANAPEGYVNEKGNPTISSSVAGIVNGDKVVEQKNSNGPDGYYVNNNSNLDKIFDPSTPIPATDKTGKNNEGYSVIGNKYKVGNKYMAGSSAQGTKSNKAVNPAAKYDPSKPKNVSYFGSSDIGPKNVNKSAIVYYVLDTWNYRDGYQSNDQELKDLTAFAANSKNTINGILIHSFASPEGGYARNTQLADERTKATFSRIKGEFKKAGVDKIYDDEFYLRTSTDEDWEGWKRGVAISNFSDGKEILDIINSALTNDQKEAKIKAEHSATYKVMVEEILPKLRRSVVSVNATIPNRTPEEIMQTAKTNITDLNEQELLYLAMASTDDKERETAYRTFIGKQPNDWRGYNNLGATLIREGKTQEAITQLEKADKISPNNGFIYNNLGVAYKDVKNYSKSEYYYNKAKALGLNENNNMGNLYVRKGMYKEALSLYGNNSKSYNAALANTLTGNYSEANKSIDGMDTDEKDALAYYLKAIIGARSGNADAMGKNLRMAIEKDARFRETAKGDLEFRKYFDSMDFKSAIR